MSLEDVPTVGLSVIVNPEHPTLDIVFIHGFTGHPQRTWTHKGYTKNQTSSQDESSEGRPSKIRRIFKSGSAHGSAPSKPVYWPRDLLPTDCPNARILTYGYDTQIRHWAGPALNQSTVYDISWGFLIELEAERRLQPQRPLLFIAHSLGGIIVKEVLRRSRGCEIHQQHLSDIYKSTRGVIFFGTPHGGADPRGLILNVAQKVLEVMGFRANDQIVNTLLPSSERLRELRDEFAPMARQNNWIIYCFQEQYGVQFLGEKKIVEDSASCLNDPTIEITQHIASDHMGICQFFGSNDRQYAKAVAAIDRVLLSIETTGPQRATRLYGEDLRGKFLDSLRFNFDDFRHETIGHASGSTCEWLLNDEKYRSWLEEKFSPTHHRILWIKGKPATGKSTVMKYLLSKSRERTPNSVFISFFFHARGDILEKSILGMYRSMLWQLLTRIPELQNVFQRHELSLFLDHHHNQDVEILKIFFSRAIENLDKHRIVCFVDALDECDENQARELVASLERLSQFAVHKRQYLHVCLSSRLYPHISIECLEVTLEEQEGHQEDIVKYLNSELKAEDGELIQQIKDEIVARASHIFLWVVLVVRMLNIEFDHGRLHAMKVRLDQIPDGLDELFKDMLSRDDSHKEESLLCIQWILYARRPLRKEELYYAILSGIEPESVNTWKPSRITAKDIRKFILSSSKGLVEITKGRNQTVQFIHESVRDFFLSGNGLIELQDRVGENVHGLSHEVLKRCCESYYKIDYSQYFPSPNSTTRSKLIADLPEESRKLAWSEFPLLEYATSGVLYHANIAEQLGIPQDTFLQDFQFETSVYFYNLFGRVGNIQYPKHTGPLEMLLKEKFLHLFIRKVDLSTNLEYISKDLWACIRHADRSHLEGDDILIAIFGLSVQDAHLLNHLGGKLYIFFDKQPGPPHSIDNLLSWSASRGDLNLVALVLKSSRFKTSRECRLSLSFFAAKYGHETIMRLLSNYADIELNAIDEHGNTLLLEAARYNQEATINMLLEIEQVDANALNCEGNMPLSLAVYLRHDAVAQSLPEPEEMKCHELQRTITTLPSLAAYHGQNIVPLLLKVEKVDVNKAYRGITTPLALAAARRHETIVKLLIETGRVDLNDLGSYGESSLLLAAMCGHETVVKQILEFGKFDVNCRDNRGRTPLLLAVKYEYESIVQLLLDNGRVDVDASDQTGCTPLLEAIRGEHEMIVKLFLETGKIDVDASDELGDTPLLTAVNCGNETIVELLLKTGKIKVDAVNNIGVTPLLLAATHGHEVIAELLLKTGKVDINAQEKNDETPLWRAASSGHTEVVRLLLQTRNADIDAVNRDGRTPLHEAAALGKWTSVKLLLETGKANVDATDVLGNTPLLSAIEGEHWIIVKLLLETGEVDVHAVNIRGQTPLLAASKRGREHIATLLTDFCQENKKDGKRRG